MEGKKSEFSMFSGFAIGFATRNDEKGKCVRYIMLPLNPIMEFRILYHLKCSAGLESEAIPNQ